MPDDIAYTAKNLGQMVSEYPFDDIRFKVNPPEGFDPREKRDPEDREQTDFFAPINNEFVEYMKRKAPKLDELLKGLAERDELPVDSRPVNPFAISYSWKNRFKSRNNKYAEPMAEKHKELSRLFLQSFSRNMQILSIKMVDQWLDRNTIRLESKAPVPTPEIVWFIAAVHNAVWLRKKWGRHQRELKRIQWELDRNKGWRRWIKKIIDFILGRTKKIDWPRFDMDMARSLKSLNSEFLDHIFYGLESISFTHAGDALALHAISLRLNDLLHPMQPLEISYPTDEAASPVPPKTDETEVYPEEIERMFEDIRLRSPLSRLIYCGTPMPDKGKRRAGGDTSAADDNGQASGGETAAPEQMDRQTDWKDVEQLFYTDSAKDLLRYVHNKWSSRMSQLPRTMEKDLTILLAMRDIERHLFKKSGDKKETVMNNWLLFVAGFLRSVSTEKPVGRSKAGKWRAWYARSCSQKTLAEWAGKIAYKAEKIAESNRPYQYTKLVWLWKDIAEKTVGVWSIGEGHELLCMGLWIKGFVSEARQAMEKSRSEGNVYLKVAKSAIDYSLGQLVELWESSLFMEADAKRKYRGTSVDDENLVECLNCLLEYLLGNQFYLSLRPFARASLMEDALEKDVSEREKDVPEPESVRKDVKFYQYTD